MNLDFRIGVYFILKACIDSFDYTYLAGRVLYRYDILVNYFEIIVFFIGVPTQFFRF